MMSSPLPLKPRLEIGVVPTHIKFAGGLAPDGDGRLPRNEAGELVVVAEMAALQAASPVTIHSAQVTVFPGVDESDMEQLIHGLRQQGLVVHLILMIGGADPMNPDDEDRVVDMLKAGVDLAKRHQITQIASTSIEEWMQPGARPKTGADFEAAIAQNVRVHTRVVRESNLTDSSIEHWHIEFLRGGEFQTFTDLGKGWAFVQAANRELGHPFFQIMVDAAHCGDSCLSIPENQALIAEIARSGEMGMFHASAKTTRGCLSTDDGWVSALLSAAAATGELRHVFVELFHHEDPALEPLRQLDPGHGIDTTDGRSYRDTVVDSLTDVVRRLNNLHQRGVFPS